MMRVSANLPAEAGWETYERIVLLLDYQRFTSSYSSRRFAARDC